MEIYKWTESDFQSMKRLLDAEIETHGSTDFLKYAWRALETLKLARNDYCIRESNLWWDSLSDDVAAYLSLKYNNGPVAYIWANEVKGD